MRPKTNCKGWPMRVQKLVYCPRFCPVPDFAPVRKPIFVFPDVA